MLIFLEGVIMLLKFNSYSSGKRGHRVTFPVETG